MTMMTQATHEKIYVWAKTELAGKIVRVAEAQPESKWLYFTDGTRVSQGLLGEMMLPARSEEEAAAIAGTLSGVVTPAPKVVTPATQPTEPVAEINVMMEMLAKMSRKNTAIMQVGVNIPTIGVYEMLLNEMDLEREDLNEQIGLLVENQINNLQEQLKEQIKTFINNYYKLDKND
jgi:hypothetical protein